MTRQDVGVVAVVALATAVVAVGTDLTGRLVAANSPQAEIRWPVLKHGAIEITLRGLEKGHAAELEAVNTGTETQTFQGTLTLVSQTIPSFVSRAPTMARPTPNQNMNILITLRPGERKIVPYAPDAKIAARPQPQPSAAAFAPNLPAAAAPAATPPIPVLSNVRELTQTQVQALGSLVQGTMVFYVLSDGKSSVSTQPMSLGLPAGAASNSNGSNSAPLRQVAAQQVQASQ